MHACAPAWRSRFAATRSGALRAVRKELLEDPLIPAPAPCHLLTPIFPTPHRSFTIRSQLMSTDPDPLNLLRSTFGFDIFREGQEPAVSKLLAGRSVLAIFPTGAGKSLCYQLPALLLDGVTLVISPLIALMKDQIDFLKSKGIAAARLDSSITAEEARDVYRDLRAGTL